MTGYVWADDPERHLADWADQPGHHRRVTYLKAPDGSTWVCIAADLSTRRGSQGRGPSRVDAAYDCLTQLALHALQQARAQQQTP